MFDVSWKHYIISFCCFTKHHLKLFPNCDVGKSLCAFLNALVEFHAIDIFSLFYEVKWNFVAKVEKQLSLAIGDTVHIQESCEGEGFWDIALTFAIMHEVKAFIHSNIRCIESIHLISSCFPWESNL